MKIYKVKMQISIIAKFRWLTFVESDLKNSDQQVLFWCTKYDLCYTESTLLKMGAKLV